MKAFGTVMNEMMDWMIVNKPAEAEEWIDKLGAIKWKNYVTPKEADAIVAKMEPEAPWKRDQWKGAMEKHSFVMEEEPYYNSCALYVTMNMIMSDSSATIAEYVDAENTFRFVHALAINKLKDKDSRFCIRKYFDL